MSNHPISGIGQLGKIEQHGHIRLIVESVLL